MKRLLIALLCLSAFPTSYVFAQSADALTEDLVVFARKRAESSFDVPASVTALDRNTLELLNVNNLGDLTVGIPNVSFDDIGTFKGVANFQIRGLGINASIPSIDPTVGVFIDGVYQGSNHGVLLDSFDIETIQVLKGPQGTLFGRNVTAGAVLITTGSPTDEFTSKARVAMDGIGSPGGGLNKYIQYRVGGPIADGWKGSFSAHLNRDSGWFKNDFTDDEHGMNNQESFRATLIHDYSDRTTFTFKTESSDIKGDGSAGQSHANAAAQFSAGRSQDRNSFTFSNNETGIYEADTKSTTFTVNHDLDNGAITYIYGTKSIDQISMGDIDATGANIFHAPGFLDHEQDSHELRWTGNVLENGTLTVGLFDYSSELKYHEARVLAALASNMDGGGDYNVDQQAVFASLDYNLTDNLEVSIGVRDTDEDKEASIASLNKNVTAFSATAGDDWDSVLIMNRPCNVLNGGCTRDFNDAQSYSNTSTKLGAKYTIDSDRMAYFSRAVGFRSGAYNLRNTNSNVLSHPPGPTLVEEVTTYEVGYKISFEGGKATFAIFDTEIEDMQRELNEADAATGAVNQYVTNVGDAEVQGIEIDSVISLTDDLVLSLSAGYIDASYAAVTKDISGDGTVATGPIVNAADLALELPRAAPLTWSIGLNRFGSYEGWTTNSRISLAHRDKSFFTDNNKGFINKQNILNAGLDFTSPDGSMTLGIYGNNLTGEVRHGGDTQLTIGSYAPLMKGRVIGLEATYNF